VSIIDNVFASMKFGKEYSPVEIAGVTHISEDAVSKALKILEGAGMIEKTQHDRFLKNRKYTSRQRSLRV
tara:strand:- start:299 stop:508 length:210 start_codon:yes stop_codon:yes gene_type:complete